MSNQQLKEGSHRYYILVLDVRSDDIEVIITTNKHVPIEMVAIRNALAKKNPFSLIMFRPYDQDSKQILHALLSKIQTKGKLPPV